LCPFKGPVERLPVRTRRALAPLRRVGVDPQGEPRVVVADLLGRVGGVVADRGAKGGIRSSQAVEGRALDGRDAESAGVGVERPAGQARRGLRRRSLRGELRHGRLLLRRPHGQCGRSPGEEGPTPRRRTAAFAACSTAFIATRRSRRRRTRRRRSRLPSRVMVEGKPGTDAAGVSVDAYVDFVLLREGVATRGRDDTGRCDAV